MSPRRRSSQVSPARIAAVDALIRRSGASFSPAALPESPAFSRIEPRERALASRLYRGVLQNLRLLDHLAESARLFDPRRTDPALRWLLRLMLYQKIFVGGAPDYAIGQQAVEHARQMGGERAAKFINAMARRLLPMMPDSEGEIGQRLKQEEQSGPAPALRFSVPDEMAEALASGYGRDAMPGLLAAFNRDQSRVWLRVNTLRANPSAVLDSLAIDGVRVEPVVEEPSILRWDAESSPPWESKAWSRGELTVQDLGGQLAARLLAPRPGETIIDWCAAPGGKTGQIWETMGAQGRLFAHEISEPRMEILKSSLERLYGSDHAIGLIGQAEEARLAEADAVLVDAPCLALGLIGRHPEIRWDHRLRKLNEMRKTQVTILNDAAGHVRSGGRLLWVTCSPTRDENEDVIARSDLCKQGFSPGDTTPLIPLWAKPWTEVRETILRTRPDLAPVDGFAMALLHRA